MSSHVTNFDYVPQENGAGGSGGSGSTGGQISAEKKQREHLLQLNQILAQQVMQMSKIVAGEL